MQLGYEKAHESKTVRDMSREAALTESTWSVSVRRENPCSLSSFVNNKIF